MTDTPTHRSHILQVRMRQVIEWTRLLQASRAQIVEKIVRLKSNSKIARESQVNNALERTLSRIHRNLTSTENALNKIADDINKCRGLFLELSDFEVILEPQEHVHGNDETSTRDRGTVSQGTTGPTGNGSAVHDGRTPASATPADPGHSEVVHGNARYAPESHRHDGSA